MQLITSLFILLFPFYSCGNDYKRKSIKPVNVPDENNQSVANKNCSGKIGKICYGGFDADINPKSLPLSFCVINPQGEDITQEYNLQSLAESFVQKVNAKFKVQQHKIMQFHLKEIIVYEHPFYSDQGLSYLNQIVQTYGQTNSYVACMVRSLEGGVVGVVPKLAAHINQKESFTLVEMDFLTKKDDPVAVMHEMGHSWGSPHTTQETNVFVGGKSGVFDFKEILENSGTKEVPQYKVNFDFYLHPYGKQAVFPSSFYEEVDCQWDTSNIMYPFVQKEAGFFSENDCGYSYSFSHIFHWYYQVNKSLGL